MRRKKRTDPSLIEDIKAGGRERSTALEEIFYRSNFRNRVYNYIEKVNGDTSLTDDVIIEAIIIFDRSIRNEIYRYDGKVDNYIMSIARNYYSNLMRKKTKVKVQVEKVTIVDRANPELIFINEEIRQSLDNLLSLLSRECKEILSMWSNRIKYKDMRLGPVKQKDNNLRKKKYYCKQKLKDYLKENPHSIPSYYYGKSI